ncbi:DUF4386 domain-containing protein [Bauldia litoralis]|uniref:DUF4386 domain-containing protein n=1 Tax=Bauldia litoralis TaxID=665467 RepID=A0A1G6AFZ4_9HYPH|nr:DUF4386 domain-containing protein [Bauldia litoralis]SDB07315.1 protein of unknown function [Bauldia litoralis]
MDTTRRTALLAGLFFIGTFIFSIPALILYGPILDDANFVVGDGADTRIHLGAFLEILTAIANIATAVVLFPVLKRASESVALGYVATRILESTVIVVGVISLLAIVTLRQDFGGSGDNSALYVATGKALVALHDWTFLLGPAFCAGFGNGILLGYLMYRSELVPKPWAILGMVAGCIAFASATAVLFGAYEQVSPVSFVFTIPEIVWELFLGLYLTFNGFKRSRFMGAGTADLSPSPPLTGDSATEVQT